MAQISLAVKYRPKSFDDLTEQSTIKDILENQINTKTFKNAYLFTGPAGTGKTTSARIFADMMNDHKGSPIEVDGASNSGVDNIRNIIDDSKKKALDSEYKIFIIDECHALSSGAWQAMLKLLEEPPKYSIFILCTTDPQRIPPTILSRVQRYQFNKISNDGVVKRLEEIILREENDIMEHGGPDGVIRDGMEKEALEHIAKVANGGMRDAITLLDKCLSLGELTLENVLNTVGSEDYTTFFSLIDMLCKADCKCVGIIDDVYNSGKDLKQFMKEFAKFILDCEKYTIYNDMKYLSMPATSENENKLRQLDGARLFTIMDMIVTLNNAIKWDNDPKTLIELTMILYCKED